MTYLRSTLTYWMTVLLLVGCSSPPVPPEWQANALASLKSFTQAYLTGNTRLAEQDFMAVRYDIASTGRSDLSARAELVRCAVRSASLAFDDCPAYQALALDAQPPERAYAAFLSGQWSELDSALLAPDYRAVVQAGPEKTARLQTLPDPLARLVAASVLLKKGLISPADIQVALDTASAQGWRRPLLAWLGVQHQRATAVGDLEAASALQRRIDLVLSAL